jgi:hypothetical protein
MRLVDAHPSIASVVLMKGAAGLHCGIFYHSGDATCRVLHLAFHYRLRCDVELEGWGYVLPEIDDVELRVLAGHCALLAVTRPAIPYGFSFGKSRFEDDGKFVPAPGESGLTCTTFVMKVFEWARIPLLDTARWEERAEDVEAQRLLVEMLREDGASPEHVAAVEREVGLARYRSEEVAAASACRARPMGFRDAAERGAIVLADFLARVPLRVAVLGWGSLIWKVGTLQLRTEWLPGGPSLTIEFSRVSRDGRLTLVIDPIAGVSVPTRYALADFDRLDKAIASLRDREETMDSNIGVVRIRDGHTRARDAATSESIRSWALEIGVDAVIWTDLESNFARKTQRPFTVEEAASYVLALQGDQAARALEYIDKAPSDVVTPVRERIHALRAEKDA